MIVDKMSGTGVVFQTYYRLLIVEMNLQMFALKDLVVL